MTSPLKKTDKKESVDILLHNNFGASFIIIGLMGIFLGFFIIGFTTYYTYTGISCFLVGIIFIIDSLFLISLLSYDESA